MCTMDFVSGNGICTAVCPCCCGHCCFSLSDAQDGVSFQRQAFPVRLPSNAEEREGNRKREGNEPTSCAVCGVMGVVLL